MFVRFDQVIENYHWRSSWIDKHGKQVLSDDWTSTKRSLNELSQWIRYEVDHGSKAGVLVAAKAIVRWGGDIAGQRTSPKGAIPFLESLENLPEYLVATRSALSLSTADTNNTGVILGMNAMLTKVHALLATDGLPIYDSRVAGAISVLVERYRQTLAQPWTELPSALRFRATDRGNAKRRTIAISSTGTNVVDPGVMNRQNKIKCANEWAAAKIRLGWLLAAIIIESDRLGDPVVEPSISLDGSLAARMHAFEAGLFMLGFDVACL